MMKKRLLSALLMGCLCLGAWAQRGDVRDVVTFKDGSLLYGTVLEQVPGQYIKLQLADGSVQTYGMNLVLAIRKENVQSNTITTNRAVTEKALEYDPNVRIKWPTHGYRGWAELCFGGSTHDNFDATISIATIHGAQLNPHLFVGGGISFNATEGDEFWDGYYETYGVVNFFADVRYDFLCRKISPFVETRLGFGSGDFNGLYFSPSTGVRFNRFSLSLAYEVQTGEVDWYDYRHNCTTKNVNLGNVMIRCAVEFGLRNP